MPRHAKLIIDTDPGIDDAMALFYAFAAPEIEVLGLTTVFGNVTTAQATRNALHLVEFCEVGWQVAEGSETPLNGKAIYPSYAVHGAEGLGRYPAPTPERSALGENAAMYLTRMAREAPGEITVCAIGPLTNIALALQLDPGFAQNVGALVVMGGSVDAGGNITAHAEANIYHDPEAAAKVFDSALPVTLVGLDVTHRIVCSGGDFSVLAGESPKFGGFLQDISDHYLKFAESVGKFDGCNLHDPAAVIACSHPELFETVETPLRVVLEGEARGMTIADETKRSPAVKVCQKVKADAVKSLFLERVSRLS